MTSPHRSRILTPRYGWPPCRKGNAGKRSSAIFALHGLCHGRTPSSRSAMIRTVHGYRHQRGTERACGTCSWSLLLEGFGLQCACNQRSSARPGVAKGKGRRAGGGSAGLHERREEGLGHRPGSPTEGWLHPCPTRGAETLSASASPRRAAQPVNGSLRHQPSGPRPPNSRQQRASQTGRRAAPLSIDPERDELVDINVVGLWAPLRCKYHTLRLLSPQRIVPSDPRRTCKALPGLCAEKPCHRSRKRGVNSAWDPRHGRSSTLASEQRPG